MAAKGGVSGLAVAVAAIGGVFVYMGVKDVPLMDGLREFAKGNLPAGRDPKKYAQFPAAGTGSGAGSGVGTGQRAAPGTYKLGLVLPNVSNIAYEVGGKFGIKTIHGWRAVDPYPDHPSGRALDFMIDNVPNGHAVGEALSAHLIANAAAINMQYIIWNERTWNPDRKSWAFYGPAARSSSPSVRHTNHVHLTVKG